MNFKSTITILASIFICSQTGLAGRTSNQLKRGPSEISDVVRRNMGELNSCYIEKANISYDPGGKLTLAITTSGSGHVSGIKLLSYSLNQSGKKAFLKCIAQKLRTWKFPVTGAYSRTFIQSFFFG